MAQNSHPPDVKTIPFNLDLFILEAPLLVVFGVIEGVWD
jgi:hypothetical protein